MSRRNISKKRFPKPDIIYNNYLVSLFISKILKCGKKNLAKKIVYKTFEIIKQKTNKNPLIIFETAIQNASPIVTIKTRRIGSSTYQIPVEINGFKSVNFTLHWIIKYAHNRIGQNISIKLANEIIDTANNISNTIKKKEEIHKLAELNKAFAHFKY